jgi:Peptidase C10 family
MKKSIKIVLLALTAIIAAYVFICTSFPFFPDQSKCISDANCLTKTKWQQMGGFEKCTPDSLRVGCWSTALAQIAYYHQLKPFGLVQYTSRQGYKINETLDSTQFNFNLFVSAIDSSVSTKTREQLAKYSYYAALAVQKDFGTDRYMNKLASADLLEKHYRIKAERFISWNKYVPNTLGKLEKTIYNEINNKRPVFLHFANLKDFGHSVVIDGYCYQNGTFMIHTNQGQGGPDDGWYDFYKGIIKEDDNKLRVIYTIQPY